MLEETSFDRVINCTRMVFDERIATQSKGPKTKKNLW